MAQPFRILRDLSACYVAASRIPGVAGRTRAMRALIATPAGEAGESSERAPPELELPYERLCSPLPLA